MDWHAPATCPQQARVRERIRALVPAALADGGRLRAEGTISRVRGRYRLRLIMHFGGVSGERTIESPSCEDLAGAAAVALGLLIQSADSASTGTADRAATSPSGDPTSGSAASLDANPSRDGPTDTPDKAGRAASPRAPARPLEEPAVPSPSAPNGIDSRGRRTLLFLVKAPEGIVQVGPLPRPTYAVAVGGGLGFRDYRVLLGFQLAAPQTIELGNSGAAVDVRAMALELAGCRAWSLGPFDVGPCLVVALERLTAEGTGDRVESRTDSSIWASLGAAATGRVHLTRWFALSAGVGGEWEIARPRIRIEGVDDSKKLGPAALTLRGGAEWTF